MNRQNILFSVIIFATLTRVAIPPFFGHLPNFSALDALALFCGAYCERRMAAVAITLVSVWVGDMLLTHTLFYSGFYWQYGCYALIALLGSTISAPRTQKTCTGYIAMSAFASAVLFFVVSNFGVWFSGALYPQTLEGLVACYIAAIPFFKNTLASDLLFTAVFFGAMSLQKRSTVLQRWQT
jgi:hypothetical protein